MIFQNGIDGLCAPRCCLHPIHRDRLCCVTTVWLCAICGLKVLHKHLFIFLPLCFPSAALVHKRHVLAVLQCISRGEFTALRCGRVNSMCTTGCLLEVCSLKGFVCVLQTNSPARQTGLSSQLYRLKQKKWKGENVRNAWEQQESISGCSPTTELTFFTSAWVWLFKTFTFVLSLHLPHTLKQLVICWPNVLTCSTFQSGSHRENRGSFSLLTSVWLYFCVMVPVFVSTTHQHRVMSFCSLFSTRILSVQISPFSLRVNLPIPFSRVCSLFFLQNTHPLVCDSESETDVWMREQGLKVT